jgi:soluble lytic murein transglycosylase-like protein
MRSALTIGLLGIVCLAASPARADYAVLRSGLRLHITGYERQGNITRLSVSGGSVDVPTDSVVAIEPEEVFIAPPAPAAVPTGPFGKFIQDAAKQHGMDEALISSVIFAESNFNPKAVSRKQAQGLMQLIPSTAARYSVSNIFDPAQNISAGTHYLKDLLDQYHGNLQWALAAYNAGPERVDQYHGIPPYPETVEYVRRVTKKFAEEKNKKTPPPGK